MMKSNYGECWCQTHPATSRSPSALYRWLCRPCRANSGAGEPGSGAALALWSAIVWSTSQHLCSTMAWGHRRMATVIQLPKHCCCAVPDALHKPLGTPCLPWKAQSTPDQLQCITAHTRNEMFLTAVSSGKGCAMLGQTDWTKVDS